MEEKLEVNVGFKLHVIGSVYKDAAEVLRAMVRSGESQDGLRAGVLIAALSDAVFAANEASLKAEARAAKVEQARLLALETFSAAFEARTAEAAGVYLLEGANGRIEELEELVVSLKERVAELEKGDDGEAGRLSWPVGFGTQ